MKRLSREVERRLTSANGLAELPVLGAGPVLEDVGVEVVEHPAVRVVDRHHDVALPGDAAGVERHEPPTAAALARLVWGRALGADRGARVAVGAVVGAVVGEVVGHGVVADEEVLDGRGAGGHAVVVDVHGAAAEVGRGAEAVVVVVIVVVSQGLGAFAEEGVVVPREAVFAEGEALEGL